MNTIIIDGVLATTIPQSWQSDAERIQTLERENADLRVQLEAKVQLRTELKTVLESWDEVFNSSEKDMLGLLIACSNLSLAYRAARDGDAV
jgi:hypothetical protein